MPSSAARLPPITFPEGTVPPVRSRRLQGPRRLRARSHLAEALRSETQPPSLQGAHKNIQI